MLGKAIEVQLAPNNFHQELVAKMQTTGFARMYRFTANTHRDKKLHSFSDTYAQETSHFFYLPNCGFLLQLALLEQVTPRGSFASWSGTAYLHLDRREMIEHEVHFICNRSAWDECAPLDHIMGNLEGILAPFKLQGYGEQLHDSTKDYATCYDWQFACDGPITTEQLVMLADGLRTQFGPFLLPKLPRKFNAAFFTSCRWQGIEERFWRSFPTRLLRERVDGPIRGIHSPIR